jgi:hypothetical protein
MANSVNSNAMQLESKETKLSPEQKLWRAVMATAIYDALHTPNRTKKGKYKVFTELYDIEDARTWFKERDGNFDLVCEALDLDADKVHKVMNQKIQQRKFLERIEKI